MRSVKNRLDYPCQGEVLHVSGAHLNDVHITGNEIGTLTAEALQSGQWRDRGFRAYSVNTPPVRVFLGRKNPYVTFLDQLKDKLVSLGFEEFDGPLLETEFWNSWSPTWC